MKTHFNLDRQKLSAEHIAKKERFDQVLDSYKHLKVPLYQKPWFYGSVGFSVVALIVGLSLFSGDKEPAENPEKLAASATVVGDLQDTPCIQPISETSDLAFNVYSIDPQKGGNIVLGTGTEIRIPANSLLAKENSPVEMRVREFQNKEEAFIAGIPMDEGQSNAFESAGMIEIRAEQNGQTVQINPEKPLDVSLALYKNPTDFQFWYLDEKEKKWSKHDALFSKEDLKDNKKELKKVEITLKKVNEKIDVCVEKLEQVAQPETNNSLIPTLGSRKLQIDFDEKDFPELKGYKDIEFEYVTYNEEVAKVLKSQVWNAVSLKKAGDYVALFSNSKGSQSVKVRPVLKGKTLQEVENQLKEANEFRESEFKRLTLEKESLQKRALQLQAKYEGMIEDMQLDLNNAYAQGIENRKNRFATETVMNQATADFQVTRFGLYNCDKPIPYPPSRNEYFIYADANDNELNPESVYVFDLKKDCRYNFSRGGLHRLEHVGWFNNPTTLVLLDKEGRMFFANDVQNQSKTTAKIKFTKLDNSGTNVDNLKKIIRESVAVV